MLVREYYVLGDIVNGDSNTENFESLEEAKKALKSAEEDYEKRILEEEKEIDEIRAQGYEVKDPYPASEFFYIKMVTTIFDEDGDIEREREEIVWV